MSNVTNIILSYEVLTDPLLTIDPLNEWLFTRYRSTLEDMKGHAGGNKGMEVEVWMGAFNHFNLFEFETQLGSWPENLCITVMVQKQDDDNFKAVIHNG